MNIHELKELILQQSRFGLGKAITLVESTRADHRELADQFIKNILPHTGKSIRIGISGSPGVGKSTFIEAFGLYLIGLGKRVAVLAVDPSSPLHGGSILGDKTRMNELANTPEAYIRPSPSSGSLGGVHRRTRESLLVCEAADFDVIIIETVGVGQSEVSVASMVDIFIPLHLPSSGDELQGIKKGVMELADLVVITKADGNLHSAAKLAQLDIQRAFSLVRMNDRHQIPNVLLVSSIEKTGIDDTWKAIELFIKEQKETGAFQKRRQSQLLSWFEQEISEELAHILSSKKDYQKTRHELQTAVINSEMSARSAALELLKRLLATPSP